MNTTNFSDVKRPSLGMAWYKFLIYFGLIASAILNIIYGLNYISGGIYFVQTNGEVSAQQVYHYYGSSLQFVDSLYGFFLIIFAILAFVVRHKLAKYKPDSLIFVKIFYSIAAGVPFLYAILVSVVTGQALAAQSITSVIVGLIILFLNIKYFKKRSHLFVGKATNPVAPEQTTTMLCAKCGAKLHEDSTFCHKCGTRSVPDPYQGNNWRG